MADGWARYLKGGLFTAYSAGVEKHGMNANAVKVMAEAGVDISHVQSSLITELPVQDFDYVVTLCGHANEMCPFFPAKTKVVHVGFDDPPKLAENALSEDDALKHYRRVRDEIKDFVETLPDALLS